MAEKTAEKKKTKFFTKMGKFFRDCKNEIKKIVWPTPNTVFRNMGVVLAMIIIIGLFIYGLDTGLRALLRLFMSVA